MVSFHRVTMSLNDVLAGIEDSGRQLRGRRYLSVAMEPPLEVGQQESDVDSAGSDAEDDDITQLVQHLPRRLLRSGAQPTEATTRSSLPWLRRR